MNLASKNTLHVPVEWLHLLDELDERETEEEIAEETKSIIDLLKSITVDGKWKQPKESSNESSR